jgi:hypothetical protein
MTGPQRRVTEAELDEVTGQSLDDLADLVHLKRLGSGFSELDANLRERVRSALRGAGLLMQTNLPEPAQPPLAEVQARHLDGARANIALWRGELPGEHVAMSVESLAKEYAAWEMAGHNRARFIVESLEKRNKELTSQSESLQMLARKQDVELRKLYTLTRAASETAKEQVKLGIQEGLARVWQVQPDFAHLVCNDCGEPLRDHLVALGEGCALTCRRDL